MVTLLNKLPKEGYKAKAKVKDLLNNNLKVNRNHKEHLKILQSNRSPFLLFYLNMTMVYRIVITLNEFSQTASGPQPLSTTPIALLQTEQQTTMVE